MTTESALVRGLIQKAILDVLASVPVSDWLYTGEIAEHLPMEVLQDDKETKRRFDRGDSEKHVRENLASNRLGRILGLMKKEGLVVQQHPSLSDPNRVYKGMRGYGTKSVWKLGPMSDLLKEQGILS